MNCVDVQPSFGPDPYLNGEGAFYTITGIQSVGVMACAKHLVANNQEHWRYGLSAIVDDRTMHELYWYPFLRSIEVPYFLFKFHRRSIDIRPASSRLCVPTIK
jgi:beta-glucosidase-like glycosyl hydrolase